MSERVKMLLLLILIEDCVKYKIVQSSSSKSKKPQVPEAEGAR